MLTKLSLPTDGVYTEAEADDRLAALAPEAAAQGLVFRKIDVTTFATPGRYFLLQAFCKVHDLPLAPDSACEKCLTSL